MREKFQKYAKEILVFGIVLLLFANALSILRSTKLTDTPLTLKRVSLLHQENYTFAQEKPVMLYFWATWCPICKMQSSNIQRLSQNYEVITIAVRSGDDNAIKEYLQGHNLDFKVINDFDGALAEKFGISVFPTTLIYNQQGEYFYGDVGYTSTLGLWLRMWWVE